MAVTTQIPGIIFNGTQKPIIDSDESLYYLPYFKEEDYFEIPENEIAFIKGCEKLARKHDFLRVTYPKYLREIVGLQTCQVLSNIEHDGNKKVTIELHHGPILTMFDICAIITLHHRRHGATDLTTFKVANEVIEQHRQNHCRVMFLAKSVHQQVTNDNIYINYNQGFGDTNAFLELYKDGVSREMKMKINEYIAWSRSNDSTDNEVLALAKTMRHWGNNDFDEMDFIFDTEGEE